MLAIKLQRIGKKHQPSYRLVVAEKKSKLNAPPVEDLGSYNPDTKKSTFNKERVKYWLGIGAQPTVTSHNLLVTAGVIEGKKLAIKMNKVAPTPASSGDGVPTPEGVGEVKPEGAPEAPVATEPVAETPVEQPAA